MFLSTRVVRLRLASLAMVALAGVAVAGEPILQRHDSGQTVCYDMEGEPMACNSPLFPMQDARVGRDPAGEDGVLAKIGGGHGGFDFTKIANDGSELPSDATLGPNPEDWACTRDNRTGLLWEIKTASGMRSFQWSYYWYDPDPESNGGNEGLPGSIEPICGFTMECNTHAYIEYVNSIALCGNTEWRLPEVDEIVNVVNYDSSYPDGGAMDRVYFNDGNNYSGFGGGWTATTAFEPPEGEAAWSMNFDDGHAEMAPKPTPWPVRAVSGETPPPPGGAEPMCGKRENPQIPATTAGAFTLDEVGIATDARSGLSWSRCAIGQELVGEGPDAFCEGEAQPMNWQEALLAAQDRNAEMWLGHDDWRVPNVKELMSIFERRCFGPVVDLAVFPESGLIYWSSTTYDWHPEQAWALEFFGGNNATMNKGEAFPVVRLVRGGGAFDDYSGTPSYSVGGSVAGMVGGDIELRLETGGGEEELLTVAANGEFTFAHAFASGDTWSVSVSQPPVPFQQCSVTNDEGAIADHDVTDVTVTCEVPDPAVIEVNPADLAFSVLEGGSANGAFSITNAGGGILHWNIETAHAKSAPALAGAIDCEAEPGIIIQDDGSFENAYSGNSAWPGGVAIVDRFTPSSYPASIRSLCLALAGAGGHTSLDFEIVVLDDNGADGAPGTELGAIAASASGIPAYPPAAPTWFSYDISSLYTTIDSGSLYVGIRWQPASVNNQVYLLADQSNDRPPGHAGGYYWNTGGSGLWMPTEQRFAEYRSMFLRAVVGDAQPLPVGCDDPHAVPWLEVSPAAGNTLAGESSEVSVSINASGLAVGNYSATLCVHSDDSAGNELVEIPVSLGVSEQTGELVVAPTAIDFGPVPLGTTAAEQGVTITNGGAAALGDINPAIPAAPFGRSGGDCPAAPFALEPGESCTIAYTFAPQTLGPHNQNLAVTSDADSASIALSGTGVPGAPASLVVVSGSGQSAVVGEAFPVPLTVEVRDAFDNPLAGIEVTFAAPASGPGAALSATEVATGSDGRAAVTATANTEPGAYVVTANIAALGDTAVFDLANVPGAPASLVVVSGNGQSATVGEVFPVPLTVEVRDAFDNPLAGIEVTFEAPASGPGAALSATEVATGSDGRAAVTATANAEPGGYAVDAILAASGDAVQFALTNLAGEPADRIFSSGFEESGGPLPPGIAWIAGYDGHDDRDDAEAVALDAQGNVYVTGWSVVATGNNQYATVKFDNAGNRQWVATWDDPAGMWDEAYAIAVDPAGNSWVTGRSYSSGFRSVTIKYDTNGVEQWVQRDPVGSVAMSIALDADGNAYVGALRGFDGYQTIKYDAAGNVAWSRSFDAAGVNPNIGNRIVVREGRGVYVGSPVFNEALGPGSVDYLVVHYDFDGNLLWSSRYFNDAGTFYDVAMAVDEQGNVFMGGGSSDYRVVKFDSDGEFAWAATAGGEGGAITALATDAAGNVYSGGIIGCGGSACFGVMKHDAAGNELWRQTYDPGFGGTDNLVNALVPAADGGVYATGYNVVAPASLLTEYVTARYGPDGEEIWLERYTGPFDGYSEGRAMTLDADGNAYVTGRSTHDPDGTGNWDFVTIKYGGG